MFEQIQVAPPSSQAPSNSALPNAAVSTLSNKTYDIFAVPPVLTYTTSSNNATGAGTVTQYIFNNNVLNAAVTTNGSAAASIVNTYGDGFSGKVYENGFRSWNGGRGILVKGFTLSVTNYTSGAQVGSYFNTLSFQLLSANFQGGVLAVPFDVSAAVNNQQYQVGIVTVRQNMYLNAGSQISVSLPANTIFAFTFFTEAATF